MRKTGLRLEPGLCNMGEDCCSLSSAIGASLSELSLLTTVISSSSFPFLLLLVLFATGLLAAAGFFLLRLDVWPVFSSSLHSLGKIGDLEVSLECDFKKELSWTVAELSALLQGKRKNKSAADF